ncbi:MULTISPECIES: methionine ABC transporter permease [Nosocomiicoccus]|uniref:Methionine ABC transporter permease n=1 Tax=Nosocomiicoccus massiliensis TaxID=1232430 RepID=A0AAF0YH75_9STAP|nr:MULTISPECIES: methionine ABC transporter permease [Nosocomiicoccus]MDK6862767.1 methionine ABC transporter permease [Nosocomiicoccus ampullae]OFS63118.1 methionine ABC transporter permease [Nosocomiicoccus sp. HMSC09A07]WOS95628.1 methionine ABC transporter permease [Nosocomiicoccus massiliensis]
MLVSTDRILSALVETLQMVTISFVFSILLGIPLGVLLYVTRNGGILEEKITFTILSFVINILRSIPFIILLVAIIPFTRLIVGSSIGTAAAIVPMVVYAGPYVARLVESSLLEVDDGVLEAADAMGATPLQTIFRFVIPEALGSLILNFTIATIGLVGASAMAGTVGGGGIGDLAITYGYQRFDGMTMLVTVVILVVLVQGLQSLGNGLSRIVRRK